MKTLLTVALFITILNSCTKDEDINPIPQQIETIKKQVWKINCTVEQKTEFYSPQFENARKHYLNNTTCVANIFEVNDYVTVHLKKLEEVSLNKKMKIKIQVTTTYSTGRIEVKADSITGITQYLSLRLRQNPEIQ